MKCYIIDTLVGVFATDELGNILNFIYVSGSSQEILDFYQDIEEKRLPTEYKDFLRELKGSGFDEFIFDNKELEETTFSENFVTLYNPISLEFRNFRLNLSEKLKTIGLEKRIEDIKAQFKEIEQNMIKKEISKSGAQSDIIIIQIIETLDILKKSISLFSSRLREWYGLHFPELTDKLIEDNVILAEMISILGNRENFTISNLEENFDLSDARITDLNNLATESMGAKIDIPIIKGYADQIISLDRYRIKLENYLEELLEKTAPNLNAIVGSLIGAKLIAKAGSLKKLAFMPASRIQLLGAEKALYRFLKTGEKRPKHGLIFQWNQIRGSKPWNRGKISRLIAGKIGISAKVDYFNGDFIAEKISKDIEQKILEIEKKYPNPPKQEKTPKKKEYNSKKQKKRSKR